MAEITEGTAGTQIPGPGAGQFMLEHIYLKDCSFESPLSPSAFGEQYSPELNVNIQTRINGLMGRPEAREVVLSVTAEAKVADDQSLFVVEAHMGALIALGAGREEDQNRLLGTRVPEMLFPYLRETISNLVVRGGFMPLMLQPMDFDAIYQQQVAQQGRQLDG